MSLDEDKLRFPRSYLNVIDKLVREIESLKAAKPISVDALDEISHVAGDLTGATLWINDPATGAVRGIWTANPRDETGNWDMVFFNPAGVITVGIDADTGALMAGAGAVVLDETGIDAIAGSIAGWTIDATTIKKLTAGIGIIIDSSVPKIQVGDTSGVHIVLDGAFERIRSSNFISGQSGFNIAANTGDAEFNNIVARGEIKTTLFTTQNQMAVAGDIMITKDAGKLAVGVLTTDTTVDFGKAMTPGDWIKIKGPDYLGTNNVEWMLVGTLVSGTEYNVTRDIDGSGVNRWAKDTPFVVIGAEGDTRLEFTSGATGGIRLIIQGSAWNISFVQAEMSAADGAVMAGRGAVVINEHGMTLPDAGDALSFVDNIWTSYGKITSYIGGIKIRSNRLMSTANQLTNGNFATGDFTGWTVTNPSGKLTVEAVDSGYAMKAVNASSANEYIEQSISATEGYLVSFKAKTGGVGQSGTVIIQGAGLSLTEYVNTNEWRDYSVVIDRSTTSVRVSVTSTTTVYVTDITAQRRVSGLPMGQVIVGDTTLELKGTTLFNPNGDDTDWRMKGVVDGNVFYLDASTDRIGVGKSNPGYKVDVVGDVNVSGSFRVNGTAITSGSTPDAYFGDGSDGAAVLNGSNTFAWASLAGSTYTLLRNIHITDLTVNSGVTLVGAGYQIFVSGTLTNSGTIHNDGSDASASTGGSGAGGNPGIATITRNEYYNSGTNGGNGVASGAAAAVGSNGQDQAPNNSLLGGRGGRGAGAYATPTTYSGGGSGSALNNIPLLPRSGGRILRKQMKWALSRSLYQGTGGDIVFLPGMGGGGGSKSATGTSCSSGGGGGGGGCMLIAAKTIINNASSRISCNGGNGANAVGTGANAGGGAGGGGGLLWLVYNAITNNGTISANGGTGGTSVAGGSTPVRGIGRSLGVSESGTLDVGVTGQGGQKNTMYLLAVHSQGGAPTPPTATVTGWGLTWTQIATVDFSTIASPNRKLTLFYAYGTPDLEENSYAQIFVRFSGTVTAAYATLDEIQNVSNTIVQNATNRSDSTTNLTVTLAAVASADNPIYACFGMSQGTARVAGTNFTKLSDPGAPTSALTATEIGFNDNTPNMTWTTASAAGAIAIELQAVASMEDGGVGEDGYVGYFKV